MEDLWSAKQCWLCTLVSSSIPENTAGEHTPAWPQHTAAWQGVLSNSTGEVEESVIFAGYNKHSFYISQTGTTIPMECLKCWNSPAVFFGHWCAVSGQKLSHAFGLSTSVSLLCQGNFAHY